jgi:hypothetical protein
VNRRARVFNSVEREIHRGGGEVEGDKNREGIHFFLALFGAPRGGVTGRPVFRPPYVNFLLSAGCKQNETKL